MVLRSFGRRGLAAHIRHSVSLANHFVELLQRENVFQVRAWRGPVLCCAHAVAIAAVCAGANGAGGLCAQGACCWVSRARVALTVAAQDRDPELNRVVVEKVNTSGKVRVPACAAAHTLRRRAQIFLINTKLDGLTVIRLAVGGLGQTRADVEHAYGVLCEAARSLS